MCRQEPGLPPPRASVPSAGGMDPWRGRPRLPSPSETCPLAQEHDQPSGLSVPERGLGKVSGWALSWPVPFTVSLPRLVDLDWRVDIKTSSDSISRMAVPTCLLQMKVRPPPRS